MNINKFTQSSMAAVQGCEKAAMDYGNQEIEQEHLFYALLTIDDSLILKLFEKMGITKETAVNRAEEALRKRPKVQGGQMFIGKDLNNVLVYAEDEAKQMGDEYVSVDQTCKPGNEAAVPGVWHYKRQFPAGFVNRERQSARDQR